MSKLYVYESVSVFGSIYMCIWLRLRLLLCLRPDHSRSPRPREYIYSFTQLVLNKCYRFIISVSFANVTLPLSKRKWQVVIHVFDWRAGQYNDSSKLSHHLLCRFTLRLRVIAHCSMRGPTCHNAGTNGFNSSQQQPVSE